MNGCVFCGKAIQRDISLGFIFSFDEVKKPLVCGNCFNKFERLEMQKACAGCFRKQENQEFCEDCLRWTDILPKHRALFSYNELARAYMNRFKFQGDVLLAQVFSAYLKEALEKLQKTHLIVPIPASRATQKTRGFNQVEVLLKEAGIPFESFLVHTGKAKKQSSKNRRERMQAEQPFAIKKKEGLKIKRPILLVDDVYTTGRTIFHARELLEEYSKTASFSLFR